MFKSLKAAAGRGEKSQPATGGRPSGFGSGDEAGGNAPASAEGSPRIGRMMSGSMSPLGSAASSFAEDKQRLHNLLAEMHETVFLEDFSPSASACSPSGPSPTASECEREGALRTDSEEGLVVRNLDTGEWKTIMEMSEEEGPDTRFFGRWEDPGTLAKSRAAAWDGWRQDVRRNNEELWNAAETGSTARLCDLLSSPRAWSIKEDPDMEDDSRPQNDVLRLDSCSSFPYSPTSSITPYSGCASPTASAPLASLSAALGEAHQHSSSSSTAPCAGAIESHDWGAEVDKANKGSVQSCGSSAGGSLQASFAAEGMMRVNIDSRSLHGRTALHIAASNGQTDCVEVLLKARADIDASTDAGYTALHLACERNCISIVRSLLAAECDAAAQTKQGELALHLAAAKGHTEVLSLLLKQCTKGLLGVRNNYGQRPAAVCHDIETNTLLSSMEGSANESASSSCRASSEDSYAGRRPFDSVLLRNSRADVVHRLLQRTGAEPEKRAAGSPAGADGAAGPSSGSRSAERERLKKKRKEKERDRLKPGGVPRRTSFSKLHADSQEVVGPDFFSLKSVLGKGSFGEVYQVVHKQSGKVYAMKVLRKSKIFGRNLVRYAMTERNLLSYIRHPFIVRLHYAFQTPTCLVLVLHYCPGGNLSQQIAHEGRLQELTAQLYIAEVFLAIEYLHARQVVYRDLKPENVVMDEGGHAMLTDFGLSKEGVDGLQGTKSFCGSVAYLAPEILARRGHGPPVDLYGLGVLLYEMLAGRPPYYSRDRETLFRNIVSASLNVPSTASSRATSLIHSLMRRDPAQRLGAKNTSEVRSHPFFVSLDFDRVLKREVPVPSPRRHKREASPKKETKEQKVSSPFEGRLEAQVRRSWSSSSQDISGWEFATAGHGGRVPQSSKPSDPTAKSTDAAKRNSRRGKSGPVEDWMAPNPTFF